MGTIKTDFSIFGAEELDKALKDVGKNVAKKILRKSMRPAMKIIQKEVKSRTPVDTGAMKKTVKVRASKRSRVSQGVDVQVGDKNYIPKFIEFGTSRIPPKPFVGPSFDAKGAQARDFAVAKLKELLKQEVKANAVK